MLARLKVFHKRETRSYNALSSSSLLVALIVLVVCSAIAIDKSLEYYPHKPKNWQQQSLVFTVIPSAIIVTAIGRNLYRNVRFTLIKTFSSFTLFHLQCTIYISAFRIRLYLSFLVPSPSSFFP